MFEIIVCFIYLILGDFDIIWFVIVVEGEYYCKFCVFLDIILVLLMFL